MKTRIPKRMFSLLLVLVMLVSILPVPSFAADVLTSTTTNSNTDDGISMKKTSVYDPDTGKMDITIEAYTTGTVVSSTRTVPTDIVLVLDVSGSMNSTRMNSMKNAVNNFISATKVQNDSVTDDADKHSIAIIKFADDSFYNNSNPLAVGNHRNSNNYNYTEVIANFTTVNESGVTALQNTVNSLASGGATAVDYGLNLTQLLLDARADANDGAYAERNKVVIVFADGEPNHSNGYDEEVAYNAVEYAYGLKAAGAKVFTIGIFDGADHTDTTSDANKFMNYLSSNYPLAYGSTTVETGYWGFIPYEYTAYHINPGAAPHYNTYYHDADTDSLNSVFQTIASSVGSPQITLGSSATLVDVVSDYFDISYVGSNPAISIYTSDYKGGADFNAAANWAAPVAATGITAAVSGDGDTVTVSGFDYDTNYVSATARDGGNYGKKLILKITSTPDYEAIDAAAAAGTLTSANIPTNDTGALLDSNKDAAAWVSAPELQANTVTYKVITGDNEVITNTYYRFPGAEKDLIDKPTDTDEHSYGEWETDDTTINDGSITMPTKDVEFVSEATVKEYDVTFEYHGNVPAGATTLPAGMTDIAVGTSVTLPTVTAPEGYAFSGWVEDDKDIQEGTTTFNMPAENLHFEGHFIAQPNSYKVEHYLMNTDGSWPTTATNTVTNTAVTDATVTAQLTHHTGLTYDEAKTTAAGSQAVGVSFVTVDGQRVPQGTVAADGSTVLKLYYKRNQHTVTYEYLNTVTGASVLPAGGTYYYGQEVTIAPNASAPGYAFSGWSIYTGATAIEGGKMKMPDSNVVIHGSFTANSGTKYTVEHYFEDLNDNYVCDDSKTQVLGGKTDTTATAEAISDHIGFTYEPDMSTAAGTIKGDGSLVLKLYYSRTRHTVKYQYRSSVPADASDLPTTVIYKYGDTVTVAPAATAQGYTFSGWNTTDATIADGEFSMPAKDVNIYGQFSPAANKYTVEIYEMAPDGSWPSAPDHSHTYDGVKTGETATATISAITGFTYDETKTTDSGSQPAGVSFVTVDGVKVPQATIKADGTTVLKLYFKRNQFNVTYVYDNAAPAGAPAVPVDGNSYYYEQNVTIAAKPAVPGYTFHGWSLYTGATAIEGNTMPMPNSNVTLHGSFTANSSTPYTVEHYFESASSTDHNNKANYAIDNSRTKTLYGTTDSTATAEAISDLIGFKYEPDMSTATGTIAGDGSLVLRLYYSRQRNTVTYQYLNTAPGASALPEVKTYKYGDTVTVAPAATAQGYTFSGWGTAHATITDGEFTMPAQQVVISGIFSPAANKYTVEVYEMNTDGSWPTSTDHIHSYDGVKTGDTVTATISTITGLTYDADKTSAAGSQEDGVTIVTVNGQQVPQATVAADGSTVLKLYFKRNQHTVTYEYLNTVAGASALPSEATYYYGQEVIIAANATAPGYKFTGWSIRTGDTAIVDGKMIMPDSNVILRGAFNAEGSTPYKVEHYFEDLSGNYVIDSGKTENLTGQTDTEAIAVPLSGDEITGFSFNAVKSESTRRGNIAGDGSLVLKLYYDRTVHTVTYQYTGTVPGTATPGYTLTGGVQLVTEYTTTARYGETIKVKADATADGYDFSGWTPRARLNIDANDEFVMPAGDVTFTGHFDAKVNKYKVEHYLMDLDGKYPTSTDDFYYVTNVVTDQTVSTDTNVLHPGFTYDESAANVTTGTVAADGSTVLKLYFKRNQFTVSYQYDGTVPAGASTLPETKTYYYQQEVTIAPNAAAPGYNFTGWAIHTGDTAIVGGKMAMPNHNVIIHGAFNASADTPYTVNHYFENVDSADHDNKANYTLDPDKTQHFTGTTATGVVAEPLSGTDILGFDYYPALSTADGTIAADGSLVLDLYYKRMDTVIKYQFTGSVPAGAVLPPEAHSTYGATAVAADTPFVQGYTFNGWFNELGITYGADNKFTVPAVPEIIFSGRFTADLNKYKVEHYLMGLDGKYPTTTDDFYYVTNVVTGQHVSASTDVEHTGFTYDPTAANVLSANVAGDGSTVLKVYFSRDRYTVSYQYDGTVPAGASALPASADYYYGQEVPVAPNATAIGYLFTGWAIHTGDTAIAGGKMLMPDHSVIIHGAFNADPNTPYTVEHYFEALDGSYAIDDSKTQTNLSGTTGATAIASPLSGTDIIGFSFDEAKSEATRTGIIAADGSLVLKLYYTRMESKVIYEYTGTVPTGAPAVPSAETHKYGTTVTVAANPIVNGYTFSGWTPWDTSAVSVNAGKFTMPERTVYFHGSFSANPSGYTVNHFLMTADGTYSAAPTISEHFSVDVSVGDTVKAVPVTTYRAYTYDAAKTAELNSSMVMDNGFNVPTGIVDADGTLVLNLYYSRNSYDLSYEFTGEVPDGAAKPAGRENIMHGSSVALDSATVPAGYNFDGWYLGDTKVDHTLTMPAADTTVTGSFTPASNVKYTVEYYLQNLDGSSYTKSDRSHETTGTTGTYVVAPRVDFTGFTFNMEKSTWNGHVKGDGSLVLKLYYDRNVHTVSYHYHGEDPAGIVLPATKEYKYGETFTVAPALDATAPDVFRGWYTPSISGVSSSTENAEGTVMTMPDHNVVFYGALFSYSVSYDLAGGTLNGADTVASRDVAWDEANLIPAGTPEKDGYDFTGWTYDEKAVTAADKYSDLALNYTVVNIVLVANYTGSAPVTPPAPPAPPAPATGTAKLLKVDATDASTVLADVVFELHTAAGTLVGTYTTNAKGEITVPDLEKGDYYWLEVLPAEGYTVDSTHHNFTVSGGKTTEITVTNKRTPIPQVFTGDHYGYIVGYEDGRVHPEKNISRAEVATIFFRLLDDSVREANSTRENNFSDVNEGNWFNHAVSTMSAMGIINGYEDGTFRPNAPITRAEFAAIAARFDLDGDASNTIFKDIYEHWGRREINIAANNGWVLGYEDGTFKPDSLVTRAEAMAMVNRVLQRIPESSADLLPGMIEWPDNQDTRKWYYMAVQEATNSHYYTRKGSGYEKWTELREVRNWEELEN